MSRNNLALPDFPSYSKLQNKLAMRVKNNMQHQRKGLSLALLLSSSLICCTTIKCSNPIGTKAQSYQWYILQKGAIYFFHNSPMTSKSNHKCHAIIVTKIAFLT